MKWFWVERSRLGLGLTAIGLRRGFEFYECLLVCSLQFFNSCFKILYEYDWIWLLLLRRRILCRRVESSAMLERLRTRLHCEQMRNGAHQQRDDVARSPEELPRRRWRHTACRRRRDLKLSGQLAITSVGTVALVDRRRQWTLELGWR